MIDIRFPCLLPIPAIHTWFRDGSPGNIFWSWKIGRWDWPFDSFDIICHFLLCKEVINNTENNKANSKVGSINQDKTDTNENHENQYDYIFWIWRIWWNPRIIRVMEDFLFTDHHITNKNAWLIPNFLLWGHDISPVVYQPTIIYTETRPCQYTIFWFLF